MGAGVDAAGGGGDDSTATGPSEDGTPKAGYRTMTGGTGVGESTRWSDDVSPYQALQKDLSTTIPRTTTPTTGAGGGKARFRMGDLSIDSPDVPLPKFEAYHLESMNESSSRILDQRHQHESSSYDLGSPRSKIVNVGADKLHPQLLEKILLKNLTSSPASTSSYRPKSSTPGFDNNTAMANPPSSRILFPTDLPKDWNGMINLDDTRLDSFTSPSKKTTTTNPRNIRSTTTTTKPHATLLQPTTTTDSPLRFANSSPPLLSYTQPKTRFAPTPTKEMARLMSKDNANTRGGANSSHRIGTRYQQMDSPGLDPPSVLKNWSTRGYDLVEVSPVPLILSSKTAGGGGDSLFGFEKMSSALPTSGSGSGQRNFGEGEGTTAKIDDLLNEESFARIVDDEDDSLQHHRSHRFAQEEDDDGFDERATTELDLRVEEEGYYDEDEEEDTAAVARQSGRNRDFRIQVDGPEDTLFGMKPKPSRGADGSTLTNQQRQQQQQQQQAGVGFQLKTVAMLAGGDTGIIQGSGHPYPSDSSPLAGRGGNA